MKIEDLDFWIQHDLNVLITGHYGVGKSTVVLEAFRRNGLNYRYFSASTMDPWVDLIGIPKEFGTKSDPVLKLVKLDTLDYNNVEALFFDELNRVPSIKIVNAVMELIQFKSINGTKFPKLRMVWAAINPNDDDADLNYAVDDLDRAHLDRFQVHVEMPYEPSVAYFKDKYPEVYSGALRWWNELDDKNKKVVSPRRLDYAIEMLTKGGDVSWVLPRSSGPDKFIADTMLCGVYDRIIKVFKDNNLEQAKKIFADPNQARAYMKYLEKNDVTEEIHRFCFSAMKPEQISTLLTNNPKNIINIYINCLDDEYLKETLREILNSNLNSNLSTKVNTILQNKLLQKRDKESTDLAKYFNLGITKVDNTKHKRNLTDET